MRKINDNGVSEIVGGILLISITVAIFSVIGSAFLDSANSIAKELRDYDPDFTRTETVYCNTTIYNETIKYVSNGDGIDYPRVEWQQNKTTGGYDFFISYNATLLRLVYIGGVYYNNDIKYIPPLIPE